MAAPASAPKEKAIAVLVGYNPAGGISAATLQNIGSGESGSISWLLTCSISEYVQMLRYIYPSIIEVHKQGHDGLGMEILVSKEGKHTFQPELKHFDLPRKVKKLKVELQPLVTARRASATLAMLRVELLSSENKDTLLGSFYAVFGPLPADLAKYSKLSNTRPAA